MKKIIGILAAAALLFAVSSCSNDDGVSTVDSAVSGAQDVSAVSSEASAKAAEEAAKKSGSDSSDDEDDDDDDDDTTALTGTWTASDYYPAAPTSKDADDKTAVSGSLGSVEVVGTGAVWRTTTDGIAWAHLELGKAQAGCLSFTVGATSTVVVSAASTGGSNTSDIWLGTSDGTAAGTASASSVTGSSYTDVTFTSVPAGTYYLGAFPATTNTRGVRIKSITVTAN